MSIRSFSAPRLTVFRVVALILLTVIALGVEAHAVLRGGLDA